MENLRRHIEEITSIKDEEFEQIKLFLRQEKF